MYKDALHFALKLRYKGLLESLLLQSHLIQCTECFVQPWNRKPGIHLRIRQSQITTVNHGM